MPSTRRNPESRSRPGARAPGQGASSDLLDRFAFRLGEMGRVWRSEHERKLKPLGLSLTQWHTLRCLDNGDGCVQKDLAREVGIEDAAMVGVLDRLVAAGLAERREAVHDRRAKTVHLTALAAQTLAQCERALRPMREALLSQEDAEDLETCINVFDSIVERLWEAAHCEDDGVNPRGIKT